MRYGLIRLDIEDYVTPESDDGLEVMLDQLDRHRLPASFGVVGEKAEALFRHGRQDLLRRLAEKSALGFHSRDHSRHPTLAEDLADRAYPDSVERFIDRERPGVQAVSRLVSPPRYFTQPGGNWVPSALDALPRLGMSIMFSESWNSYLVELAEPVWCGQVLHFSLPVPQPAPFLLGLPQTLDQAMQRLEDVPATIPDGGAFTIMTHPTELVTAQFWDVVNFGGGRTRCPLTAAPLRSLNDRDRAMKALDTYWQAARRLGERGIQWVDILTLAERVVPRGPANVRRGQLARALAETGLGPSRRAETGTLSAAQLVWALAYFTRHPQADAAVVPWVGAPTQWVAGQAPTTEAMSSAVVEAGAEAILYGVAQEQALPTACPSDGARIEDWAGAASQHLFGPRADRLPLTFLSYVKDPSRLHWNWPVFAPDFRPYRLWEETRRMAWTLAPVQWKSLE